MRIEEMPKELIHELHQEGRLALCVKCKKFYETDYKFPYYNLGVCKKCKGDKK